MALFETHPVGLKGFVRVKNEEPFISAFNRLYAGQGECLYNHSPIFPFAYLNLGQMKLYLNADFADRNIIPVVKKHELTLEHAPSYSIHCPNVGKTRLLDTISSLNVFSSESVEITDVTKDFAEKFIACTEGWEKIVTSNDVIQNAAALSTLAGRNFSSLRNTMKHVKNDLKPEIQALNKRNASDAICVFEKWKTLSAKKYFRITIGRDVRLIEEYCDKLDFQNTFGYVYYINGQPAAVSFGCRSAYAPEWGIDVTCKGLTETFKGIADFAFIHLMTEMNKKGITLVNDSGGTGKVLLNKRKFSPIKMIPMYDLRRKDAKLDKRTLFDPVEFLNKKIPEATSEEFIPGEMYPDL